MSTKKLTVEFHNIPEEFYDKFIGKIIKTAEYLKDDAPANHITGKEEVIKINCEDRDDNVYLEDALLKCFALYHTSELVNS